jgi:hypothetical protein
MREDRKKEIDLKWNQLIAEIEKPKKTKVESKPSTSSPSKVIRRRKGSPDLHIT